MSVKPCAMPACGNASAGGCLFTATGDFVCRETFSQPAWVNQESAWKQRTHDGWPLPSTERENKGFEKNAWVKHNGTVDPQQQQMCQQYMKDVSRVIGNDRPWCGYN